VVLTAHTTTCFDQQRATEVVFLGLPYQLGFRAAEVLPVEHIDRRTSVSRSPRDPSLLDLLIRAFVELAKAFAPHLRGILLALALAIVLVYSAVADKPTVIEVIAKAMIEAFAEPRRADRPG
jgi:hypothetical protein